jgi:hypothetical protein
MFIICYIYSYYVLLDYLLLIFIIYLFIYLFALIDAQEDGWRG